MIDPTQLSIIRDIVAIIGVIAGLSYYILTVKNANRARKIQAINQSASLGQNMEVAKISLELLEMQWDDFDDFVKKYDSTVNHDNYAKRSYFFGLLRRAGLNLKENVVDIDMTYKMLDGGYPQIQMWNKFEPIFMKQRELYEDPLRYQWFEYLVNRLIKERAKRGLPTEIKNVDGYWKDET